MTDTRLERIRSALGDQELNDHQCLVIIASIAQEPVDTIALCGCSCGYYFDAAREVRENDLGCPLHGAGKDKTPARPISQDIRAKG